MKNLVLFFNTPTQFNFPAMNNNAQEATQSRAAKQQVALARFALFFKTLIFAVVKNLVLKFSSFI